jgi:deazaflavin-dependent oxidoreductase (nitroreductase family)
LIESASKKPFLPPRWVPKLAWRIHRGLYRVSGGRMGLRLPRPDRFGLMRLTATGRRTGQDRDVMLGYIEDGLDLVTLAMNGWGADEPAWWLNLQANPDGVADLVDGPRKVTGRKATGDDRERLWARWQELDDKLDAYASLRPTETAVVILETSS